MRVHLARLGASTSQVRRASAFGLFLTLFAGALLSRSARPSSARPARPTSTGSVPAKSPTHAPSPPACAGRRQASARPAPRCSSN